jgi:O-antigen ligase
LSWPGGGLVRLLAAVSLYYVFNAIFGQSEKAALLSGRYVVLCELMAFVLLTSLRRPSHWSLWLWMILLLSSAFALLGFVEFFTGMDINPRGRWGMVPMRQNRIDGVSQNSIMFAYNNLWAAGVGLYLAFESREKWQRGLAAGLTAFLLLTALLTLNRQTPLILLFMMIAALSLFRHRMVRPLTLAFVVVGLLLAPFLAVQLGKRLQVTGSLTHDPSYALRRDKSLVMKEMIRRHTWFGIGIGAFPEVWPRYLTEELWFLQYVKPRVHYPDMGYFQVLAETGVVGFGLQGLLVGLLAHGLWRRRRQALEGGSRAVANLCAALMVLLVHFLVTQLMQDIFFFSRSWWLFAMSLVVIARPDEDLVFASRASPSPVSKSCPEVHSPPP